MTLRLSDYDFELPPELIAQAPAVPRDSSRLLVVPPAGEFGHDRFSRLPDLLNEGDLLVVNETKVIPARVIARKPTGGRVELLFVKPVGGASLREADTWEAMARPAASLKPGLVLGVARGSLPLEVIGRNGPLVVLRAPGPLWPIMEAAGELPLPPYILRNDGNRPEDQDDYQTHFAREPGAVAAPTASLHFTPQVIAGLKRRRIEVVPLTLHVGIGTFLPVREEHAADIRNHTMHSESYSIPLRTLEAIRLAQAEGRRVIGVGTTVVRTLETFAKSGKTTGDSELFIFPGFEFQIVDGMITNFHLPKSTLLMLVSAFAGSERIQEAYGSAIERRYRFFSYGDAMLLFRLP